MGHGRGPVKQAEQDQTLAASQHLQSGNTKSFMIVQCHVLHKLSWYMPSELVLWAGKFALYLNSCPFQRGWK